MQSMLSIDRRKCRSLQGDHRTSMPEVITELRLNSGNSCSNEHDRSTAATPAVALPLDAQTNLQFLWRHTASTFEYCGPDDQKVFSAYSHPESAILGIDVNQIPAASTDQSDDPNVHSPASSAHLPLQYFHGIQKIADGSYARKREMEKSRELEDRGTYEINSKGGSEEEEGCNPRKKLRLSKEQSAFLEESFRKHSTLNPKQKQSLANQLHLRPRQVEVWFQNRRARTKLKQTEVDCELLKRCCESLAQENRRLKGELQELRAMKGSTAAPVVVSEADSHVMPLHEHPSTTSYILSICPSCDHIKRQLMQPSTASNPSHRISSSGISSFTQSSAACS